MFRQTYESMNERLAPEPHLIDTTLRRMADGRKGIRWIAPVRPRRAASIVTAVVLVLCISLTVVAAVPGFRDMLFAAGSAVGQDLTPVLAEAENNGLRLEVLGTMNIQDAFSVYFTLQDVDGKERLSRSMTLDSIVQLDGARPEAPAQWYEQVLEYDPATQTALCRLDFDANSDYDVTGAAIQLELTQSTRVIETNDYIPLDVSELQTETMPVYGWYGFEDGDETPVCIQLDGPLPPAKTGECPQYSLSEWESMDFTGFEAHIWVLKPGEGRTLPGAEDVRMTAAGFVNGKFCVQVYLPGQSDGQNPYTDLSIICTEAGKGPDIAKRMAELSQQGSSEELYNYRTFKSASSMKCSLDSKGRVVAGPGYSAPGYMNFFFEISPDELENYDFFAYTTTREESDIGTQAEFSLGEGLPESLAVYGPMLVGDIRIDKVEITPMGVFLSGPWSDMENYKGIESVREVELVCGSTAVPYRMLENSGQYASKWAMDGTSLIIEASSVGSVKFLTDAQAVDAQEAIALRINGVEAPLSPVPTAAEGYEALWQAGMDISAVTILGDDAVRITGTDIHAYKIKSVEVLCGEQVIEGTDSDGGVRFTSNYTWDDTPARPQGQLGTIYQLEKNIDPADVTGVKINGILITEIGMSKY